MFQIDENTPIKDGVFFMDDDFFVDVHQHAQPPRHPHQYVEPEKVELPKSEAEKLLEQQKLEREELKKTKEIEADLAIENKVVEDFDNQLKDSKF